MKIVQKDSPITSLGVSQRRLAELAIHFRVEVVAQEKGPETEKCPHFGAFALARMRAIVKALALVFEVGLLDETCERK